MTDDTEDSGVAEESTDFDGASESPAEPDYAIPKGDHATTVSASFTSGGWVGVPGSITTTTPTIYPGSSGTISPTAWTGAAEDEVLEKAVNTPQAGTLILRRNEENGYVEAKIGGSELVIGQGEDTAEALENLTNSIASLLDFSEGAKLLQDKPHLHPTFAEQLKLLTGWAKDLGIYVS